MIAISDEPTTPKFKQGNRPVYVSLAIALTISLITFMNIPLKGASKARVATEPFTIHETAPAAPQARNLLAQELEAWDNFLGSPHHTTTLPGSPATEPGTIRPAIGLNNDPKKVFSLISMDGKPTLKISGEISGGLITKEVFQDYHLSLRFLRGEKLWSNQDGVHESGILVHAFGLPGEQFGSWMNSIEYQLRPGSCGDLFFLGTRGHIPTRTKEEHENLMFHSASTPQLVSDLVRRGSSTKETADWNTLDIYTLSTTTVFAINREVTMVVLNTEKEFLDDFYPLSKGKIQLQSAGAEIYYQDIILHKISTFPLHIQRLVDQSAAKNLEEAGRVANN